MSGVSNVIAVKLKGQSLPATSQPKLVLPESSSVKKKPGELRLAPAVPLARSNVVVTQEVRAEPSRVSVTPSPTPADTADVAIGSPESLHLFLFPSVLDPERLFVPGFLLYVPQSGIYVPRCLFYFLESHIHFPELLIELLERFGFLARCPEFMMYFHACSIWTVALTISLRSCCFLCSLFASCTVYLYPEVHYLLSVFSMLIFPSSFFPHP